MRNGSTMNLFKMAWRNLWRNRRRSLVTIGAMSFALLILLLYAGIVEGFMVAMEDDVLDYEVGDLQILADGYLDNPSLYARIDDPGAVLAELDAAGYPASARLLAGGLAAAGDLSAGVSFRGVEVAREARVSRVHERLAEGEWLDPSDAHGVVLGRRLAQILEARPGVELVVLSQGADGSIANDLYTVRGVLGSVADATDRSAVFMNAGAFRELMVVPEGAHQIVVRRPEEVPLEAAAEHVRSLAPGLDVRSWRQLMPTIASMLDSVRSMVYIIFFIAYIAVGILILNAMLTAVFERIRELGVLKALGMGPGQVLALMAIETTLQAIIAIAVGVTLSLPGMLYLSRVGIDAGTLAGTSMAGLAMRPIWYGVYNLDSFPGPIVVLLIITFLAALYPAFKAAWIRPVTAIRHQ